MARNDSPAQIIILGPHRSGTSLTTRLVNLMGAWFGEDSDSIGQNEENPKGFWERRDVIALNNEILQAHNCSWYDLSQWPLNGSETPDAAPKKKIDTAIKRWVKEMNSHGDWVVKDPRMCHTLPYWLPHLDNPVIVMTHRHPLEIAQSLRTRNMFPLHTGLALWEYAMVSIFNATRHLPVIHSYHNAMLHDPVGCTKELYTALSTHAPQLKLPETVEIEQFVSPDLHREKAKDEDRARFLSDFQNQLWGYCKAPDTLPNDALNYNKRSREFFLLTELAFALQKERLEKSELAHEKRILEHELQEANQAREAIQSAFDTELANNKQLLAELEDTQASLHASNHELNAIKRSKIWRLRCALARLVGRA